MEFITSPTEDTSIPSQNLDHEFLSNVNKTYSTYLDKVEEEATAFISSHQIPIYNFLRDLKMCDYHKVLNQFNSWYSLRDIERYICMLILTEYTSLAYSNVLYDTFGFGSFNIYTEKIITKLFLEWKKLLSQRTISVDVLLSEKFPYVLSNLRKYISRLPESREGNHRADILGLITLHQRFIELKKNNKPEITNYVTSSSSSSFNNNNNNNNNHYQRTFYSNDENCRLDFKNKDGQTVVRSSPKKVLAPTNTYSAIAAAKKPKLNDSTMSFEDKDSVDVVEGDQKCKLAFDVEVTQIGDNGEWRRSLNTANLEDRNRSQTTYNNSSTNVATPKKPIRNAFDILMSSSRRKRTTI